MMVMVACNASSRSVKESTDLQGMPEVASDNTDSIDLDSISALADSTIADTIIADTIEYEKFDDENISGTTYAGIKRIMECIAAGDAKTLAALTIYPIHRKYPLKDITRRRQMIDQFNMVFDEAFREKLQHARVEEWMKKPSAKPDVCEEGELRREGTIGA